VGNLVDFHLLKLENEVTDKQASLRYRRLFGRWPTGVAVILGKSENQAVGLTVNSLTSVSLNPLLLLFCARNESRTAAAILRDRRFSVNLLTVHQQESARHFSGVRNGHVTLRYVRQDKFVWLDGSNAVFLCEVASDHPAGDHRIIVGRVVSMTGPEESGRPLAYHDGKYTRLEATAVAALEERSNQE
jgi:3-hydroxy-9,10-secoandrosta-1,3,5(10)-triene-9,17-dione monooxygenase reductase component